MFACTISVIIPCYNAQATVAETIESALAQDVALEVIVVDDGSTDGSAGVLKGFGDRITTVFGPNQGVSGARNLGIDRARGEWIQFLDSDDLLLEGTLALRLKDAASRPVVVCDWQDFNDDHGQLSDGPVHRIDPAVLSDQAEPAIASYAWAPPAAMLYRRGLVEQIGGFRRDLPIIQDARFLFDAARLGGPFAHSDHIGARYRVLAGSLSRRKPEAFWDDVLTNGAQIEALWREAGPLDAPRLAALNAIYDNAARGLMACAGQRFFEAADRQRRLGPGTRYSRIAAPLARAIGLKPARALLSLAGRR